MIKIKIIQKRGYPKDESGYNQIAKGPLLNDEKGNILVKHKDNNSVMDISSIKTYGSYTTGFFFKMMAVAGTMYSKLSGNKAIIKTTNTAISGIAALAALNGGGIIGTVKTLVVLYKVAGAIKETKNIIAFPLKVVTKTMSFPFIKISNLYNGVIGNQKKIKIASSGMGAVEGLEIVKNINTNNFMIKQNTDFYQLQPQEYSDLKINISKLKERNIEINDEILKNLLQRTGTEVNPNFTSKLQSKYLEPFIEQPKKGVMNILQQPKKVEDLFKNEIPNEYININVNDKIGLNPLNSTQDYMESLLNPVIPIKEVPIVEEIKSHGGSKLLIGTAAFFVGLTAICVVGNKGELNDYFIFKQADSIAKALLKALFGSTAATAILFYTNIDLRAGGNIKEIPTNIIIDDTKAVVQELNKAVNIIPNIVPNIDPNIVPNIDPNIVPNIIPEINPNIVFEEK